MKELKGQHALLPLLPSWFFISSVLVFVVIIVAMAIKDLNRGREIETQTLLEKSTVLIRAFESGTRTGMGMRWRHDLRQTLLEEMAYQPGVLYIAVTTPSGKIVAHSDPTRVGTQLYSPEVMKSLNAGPSEQWRLTTLMGEPHSNQNAFEVYRIFKLTKHDDAHRGHMNRRNVASSEPITADDAENNVIFAAFDTTTLDTVQARDIRNTLIFVSILLLLALASILALYWARRYQQSSRELQEEVRRKDKLAVMGNLAAGVAHEIRNPLSSIKGFAKYFESRSLPGSEEQELAKVMAKEVDRLNRVISELLELVRPTDLRFQRVNINEIIEHSLHLVRQDAESKHIKILFAGDRHLPWVELDPDRFTQVLLNLYLNAIQAIGANGTLAISLELVEGIHLKVSIKDSGKGITADDLPHIFDPYFTTKASGTGLGLAIVQKVIEEHQGQISVTSTPQSGTIFSLTIPVMHSVTLRKVSRNDNA